MSRELETYAKEGNVDGISHTFKDICDYLALKEKHITNVQ
jgi:hypothetical protein